MVLSPIEIFQDLPRQGPILLAVSGGSDSMALLLLANAWSNFTHIDLQAVTVDHGLRPEAAAEAAFVAGTCEGLGVPHVTLAWEGVKPSSGLPDASRQARYQILEEFAEDIGATAILTAHTANDQAETVWMRLQRDNGTGFGFGQAGMSTSTRLPKGNTLFRPLLKHTRETLREYLQHHSQSWIEDPSNFDLAYERVRVRDHLQQQPILASRLLDFSSLSGRLRLQVSEQAAEYLRDHVKLRPGLILTTGKEQFDKQPVAVKTRILQVLIAVSGGMERFTSESKILPLLNWLDQSTEDAPTKRMTCGRCVIVRQRNGFAIFRENRNLPPMLLSSRDRSIWDGRFEITNDTSRNVYVGPLETSLLDELEAIHNKRFPVSPRGALMSLPAFRFDDDETVIPFLNLGKLPRGIDINPICQPMQHFCPDFDAPLNAWFNGYKRSLLDSLPVQY